MQCIANCSYLRGVSVELDALLCADLTDGLERLDGADLVVDGHDRDQPGVGTDRGLELCQVDQPDGVDGQVGDLEALLLQRAARVEHALVLRLHRDDVALFRGEEAHGALDHRVVALGRARCEDNLGRARVDQRGDLEDRTKKAYKHSRVMMSERY